MRDALGSRQFFHDRLNDLLLGVFASCRTITSRLSMAGIRKRLFSVERLHPFFQIDLIGFFEGTVFVLFVEVDLDIHVHAADRVHDMDQGLEIHFRKVIDIDTECLLDPFHAVERPVVA